MIEHLFLFFNLGCRTRKPSCFFHKQKHCPIIRIKKEKDNPPVREHWGAARKGDKFDQPITPSFYQKRGKCQ